MFPCKILVMIYNFTSLWPHYENYS